jgi:type II secretory ATPase GspE/PulE/Tfp pilus assembly ATPase PilB-like protein
MAEKLIAIEDEPVGISGRFVSLHVSAPDKLGAILDAALAADPDSVLIQPIPTQYVLDKAINEALQGIKVGVQLPFSDSGAALSFLLCGDLPAQAVAGSLAGIIAQRIVRVLCDKCKKPEKPPAGLKDKDKDMKTFRAEGCPACKGTGYSGRAALFEVVIPDAELRALLGARPDAATIKSALAKLEIATLRDRALEMYSEGTTSVEEIAEFI